VAIVREAYEKRVNACTRGRLNQMMA